MAEGYKDWSAGDILTAADLEDYTVKQSVMVFADASARTTALTSVLREGMVSYLKDTDTVEQYDGSAWAAVGQAGGKILQVVSTTKTDTFTTTSTSFTDITGLTATITPSSTSSKILIIAQVSHSQASTFGSQIRLDGGNVSGNYVGDAGTGQQQAVSGLLMQTSFRGDYSVFNSSLNYLDSPATTSATTYAAQIACGNGGTVYVNRSSVDNSNTAYTRGASTITVMEVSA